METRKPYIKKLAGFEYYVLPKVYKGGTDTELLCSLLNVKKGESVWDIGTGTGLVALKAKQSGAGRVLTTDKNPAALVNAKKNSRFLDLKIEIKKADVFGAVKSKFDLIIFNPPFSDHRAEKIHHISFWDEGHKSVAAFFAGLSKHLTPHGRSLICWSSFGKVAKLRGIAEKFGFVLLEVGKRKGRNDFTYYVFEIKKNPAG